MRPSMPRRSFRSGGTSFSRGSRPLEQNVSVKKKAQSTEELSSATFSTCALRTEIKVGRQQEESPVANTIGGRHAPIVERSQQQALNSREAALALQEPEPSQAFRPNARKPSTKLKRFENALQRLRSSRDPASALVNMAESFLTLLEPDELPVFAAGIQLVDNFAPVSDECPPTAGLEVTGTIPECLNGIYIRNGSNPQFMPSGGYHLFDGDGMLHGVRIRNGVPSYCCRFTKTHRYLKVDFLFKAFSIAHFSSLSLVVNLPTCIQSCAPFSYQVQCTCCLFLCSLCVLNPFLRLV